MKSDQDSDIKIYVKKSKADIDAAEENIDIGLAGGKAEKASELGKAFALLKPTDAVLGIFEEADSPTSSVLYQSRVLITFLCERMAKEKIESQSISANVRNSMYDYLKENAAGYYENIADGAAFSFYRLAYKKEGEQKDNIGAEFAKLCGGAKDPWLYELGKKIFDSAMKYICYLIEECDF